MERENSQDITELIGNTPLLELTNHNKINKLEESYCKT